MDHKITVKTLGKWTLVCGILSVLFYLLHDVIGAQHYPGYVWTKQAVSDLTASDAPSFVVASGFTTVHKVCGCVCSAFLCVMVMNESRVFRTGIYLFSLMNGISAAGYALFPLSSSGYDGSIQSFIHVYVITAAVVLLSIISLILIAAGSFREKKRRLGILAAAALACMFFGVVGSTVLPFGIAERFSTYSAVVFTAVLGIYGYECQFYRKD